MRYTFLLCLALTFSGYSQTLNEQYLATILGFENNTTAGYLPAGWYGAPANTIFADDQVFHGGKWSARIERTASSPETFSTLIQSIPLTLRTNTIEWRGFIKTEGVSGSVALWMRQDGADGKMVGFATTQGLGVKGTNGWAQYSISLPWHAEARTLVFGFLLSGTGKAWVDDLELSMATVLDTDHEFDNGSGVTLTALSDTQVNNLALLAEVWGFLKYHHPAVTSGQHHWDYELFRILPKVLDAVDAAGAQAAISNWIEKLGPVAECSPCATLHTSDLHLSPNIDWIQDASSLGSDLSRKLVAIHRNRSPAPAQFYVSLTPTVRNPSFDNEFVYPNLNLPDAGYQLLGLFRYWNMVEYFSPNREVMFDSPAGPRDYWRQVLVESIPGIALAADKLSYQQALIRFIAKINDTHANLWSSIAARPPIGSCYLPVDVRFVEGSPVVLRYTSASGGPASGLMPGDVIQQLDGVSVPDLVTQWTPYYADSNQAARLRDIGRYLTRGACGPASIVVRRGAETLSLTPTRMPLEQLDFSQTSKHDRAGDTFQMLSPDVAYLKLSSVKIADCARYVTDAAGTKGLIIDIRNYPSEFVVFALGSLLVSEPVDFVRFTEGDTVNPGAFHWTEPLSLTPQQPHYNGKVVILVDEVTQSSAEYTAMALRTAPGAVVIGSTTAGADGNVSTVPLPGAMSSYISGIGVFYPDKTPTQRVGIIPDLVVTPTIAGIQAGRDEVLEAAVRQINSARRDRSWRPRSGRIR